MSLSLNVKIGLIDVWLPLPRLDPTKTIHTSLHGVRNYLVYNIECGSIVGYLCTARYQTIHTIQRLNKDNPVLRNLGLTKSASWRWNSLPQCMHHFRCNARVQHVICKEKILRGGQTRGDDYSTSPHSPLRVVAVSRAVKMTRGMIIQCPLVFHSWQPLCRFTRSRSVHQHTTDSGRAWD